jgi:hypothetical protein
MPEVKMQVTGARLWCDGDKCHLTIVTEAGDVDAAVPRREIGPMLHSVLLNGVTLTMSEEEPKEDPYLLQNLKAELAAAQANQKKWEETRDTEEEGMLQHKADVMNELHISSIEGLQQRIKEIEEHGNKT